MESEVHKQTMSENLFFCRWDSQHRDSGTVISAKDELDAAKKFFRMAPAKSPERLWPMHIRWYESGKSQQLAKFADGFVRVG